MAEHILFLTGKLAEKSLRRVLASMEPVPFTWEVRVLGVSVAALMTTELIGRRLQGLEGVDRILLPGRCRGELEALEQRLAVPVERGPEELKDLPRHFGREAAPRDLSRHDVCIFAEIVDAPRMAIPDILAQAKSYAEDGADVIDVGCLPDTPFPQLEETVEALLGAGYQVSVDSLEADELLRGGRAGAHYLLSLTEQTLWIADEVDATPVLISTEGTDLEPLARAVETMTARGRAFLADPVLDPIHTGFTASLLRYEALRRRYPDITMMMGIGNLTELTHADTAGIGAVLMGIISELGIQAVLTTQVSPHCRRVVRETDVARRIMFAAREDNTPPRHVSEALLALHERDPFPYSEAEVRELAAAVSDPNYRIHVTEEGVQIFNRDTHERATDPYELFPLLELEDDPAHAFYLGMELARAQIAWQLGKRYSQDEELAWGCAVERPPEDLARFAEPRSTLKARRGGR